MATCPTCKFPFTSEESCSQFCASVSDKERAEFLAAKPGEYCVFPCSGCGLALEGEFYPDQPNTMRCSSCSRKAERQELRDVLTTALPHLPPELRTRAEEALKS